MPRGEDPPPAEGRPDTRSKSSAEFLRPGVKTESLSYNEDEMKRKTTEAIRTYDNDQKGPSDTPTLEAPPKGQEAPSVLKVFQATPEVQAAPAAAQARGEPSPRHCPRFRSARRSPPGPAPVRPPPPSTWSSSRLVRRLGLSSSPPTNGSDSPELTNDASELLEPHRNGVNPGPDHRQRSEEDPGTSCAPPGSSPRPGKRPRTGDRHRQVRPVRK